MDIELQRILKTKKYIGCTIEYYPCIISKTKNIGKLCKYEKILLNGLEKEIKNITEYFHKDRVMVITDDGTKEFLCVTEKEHIIMNGLIIVSNIDNIEPNKFPTLYKYDRVIHKNIVQYYDKYITIQEITENPNTDNTNMYTKIMFEVCTNEKYNDKILKHIKNVLQL